ncbi:hypothetical protein pb186bvf_012300 [Paramecium bursaria]
MIITIILELILKRNFLNKANTLSFSYDMLKMIQVTGYNWNQFIKQFNQYSVITVISIYYLIFRLFKDTIFKNLYV